MNFSLYVTFEIMLSILVFGAIIMAVREALTGDSEDENESA